MSIWTILRDRGENIYKVSVEKGELDRSTGLRPPTYRYERILALLGSKNFGIQLHMQLEENMVILESSAEYLVIGRKAYKTEIVSTIAGMYIYKIDKVTGNEYNSIVDHAPPEGGDYSFSF